jgi:transcriptional regulator with PAS, ATPase and Fis domain
LDTKRAHLPEPQELSADAQVRLLRVLQEKSVVPLGSNKPVKIDARIIAATHRNLTKDVAEGKFREDLFFRLNVGVFTLPPLREREGDLEVLCEIPIREYNEEVRKYRLGQEKQLSPEAKLAIARHDWPGNVREMFATILRAALWSKSDLITAADVESAMIQITPPATGILDRPMKEGFKLEEVLNEVSRHYIERALNYTKFNKTKASRLLGFANYQRLDGWTERLGLTNGDESE